MYRPQSNMLLTLLAFCEVLKSVCLATVLADSTFRRMWQLVVVCSSSQTSTLYDYYKTELIWCPFLATKFLLSLVAADTFTEVFCCSSLGERRTIVSQRDWLGSSVLCHWLDLKKNDWKLNNPTYCISVNIYSLCLPLSPVCDRRIWPVYRQASCGILCCMWR